MSILQAIANLPLGLLPISLNIFGIYWIVKICRTPSKRWLKYDNRNFLAIYSLSATLAIGIVYTFRNLFNPPVYFLGLNWTPPVAGLVTYLVATFFDLALAKRLHYKPVRQKMMDSLLALVKAKGLTSLPPERTKVLAFTFCITILPIFLIPDRDVAKGTYGSRALVLFLGNPDIQAGVAWLFAALIAVLLTATVNSFTFNQKRITQNKNGGPSGRQ